MNKFYLILLVALITSCSQVKQQELKTFTVSVETQDYKECCFYYYCDNKSEDLNFCVKAIMIINTIEIMNSNDCKDYNQVLLEISDKVSQRINKRYPKLQFKIEKIILL